MQRAGSVQSLVVRFWWLIRHHLEPGEPEANKSVTLGDRFIIIGDLFQCSFDVSISLAFADAEGKVDPGINHQLVDQHRRSHYLTELMIWLLIKIPLSNHTVDRVTISTDNRTLTNPWCHGHTLFLGMFSWAMDNNITSTRGLRAWNTTSGMSLIQNWVYSSFWQWGIWSEHLAAEVSWLN